MKYSDADVAHPLASVGGIVDEGNRMASGLVH